MPTSYDGARIEYQDRECVVRTGTYRVGGGTALLLVDPATGKELAHLSVNMPDFPLRPDEIVLRDCGASDGILEVLENVGVVASTGRTAYRGKVELPICKVMTCELDREQEHSRTSGQLGQVKRRRSHDERER